MALTLRLFLFLFLQFEHSHSFSFKHIDTGYLVNATPSKILPKFFVALQVFLLRSEEVHAIWL